MWELIVAGVGLFFAGAVLVDMIRERESRTRKFDADLRWCARVERELARLQAENERLGGEPCVG